MGEYLDKIKRALKIPIKREYSITNSYWGLGNQYEWVDKDVGKKLGPKLEARCRKLTKEILERNKRIIKVRLEFQEVVD